MVSKQDRSRVRTPEELERKYSLAEVKKSIKLHEEGLNKVEKEVENFVNAVLKDLYSSEDGSVETYYHSGTPTMSTFPVSTWDNYGDHVGDLYYDKDTGHAYRFLSENEIYAWVEVEDSDIIKALALANSALDTADSKRRVFTKEPTPPYDNGDLWFKDQEIYICQISKPEGEVYAEDDFIEAVKYTDDTLATQVGDNLEVVRGTVLTVQKSVDEYKIEFDTQLKKIDENKNETDTSLEKMKYAFGTKDLSIANSNDPVNARINNQGLKVYTYDTLQAIFNHRGSGVQSLIVVGGAQLGNLLIVKEKDENGDDCTDINYLVSKIQKLTDLEGSE